jgi:hypothetical protein
LVTFEVFDEVVVPSGEEVALVVVQNPVNVDGDAQSESIAVEMGDKLRVPTDISTNRDPPGSRQLTV